MAQVEEKELPPWAGQRMLWHNKEHVVVLADSERNLSAYGMPYYLLTLEIFDEPELKLQKLYCMFMPWMNIYQEEIARKCLLPTTVSEADAILDIFHGHKYICKTFITRYKSDESIRTDLVSVA